VVRKITDLSESAAILYDWLLLNADDRHIVKLNLDQFAQWLEEFTGKQFSSQHIRQAYEELKAKELVRIDSINVIVEPLNEI
jgi:hypothetical protein